jgi:hypothetical protein
LNFPPKWLKSPLLPLSQRGNIRGVLPLFEKEGPGEISTSTNNHGC